MRKCTALKLRTIKRVYSLITIGSYLKLIFGFKQKKHLIIIYLSLVLFCFILQWNKKDMNLNRTDLFSNLIIIKRERVSIKESLLNHKKLQTS